MIRVVVVDDQELMRAGFRLILESAGDIRVVGEAGDGEAAIDVTRSTRRGAHGHSDAAARRGDRDPAAA